MERVRDVFKKFYIRNKKRREQRENQVLKMVKKALNPPKEERVADLIIAVWK